jgi:phosphomannomutase/phosphoglucomutase
MAMATVPPHIFREYDIRGVIGTDLSEEMAYALGKAYGFSVAAAPGSPIVVGYDCRPTSRLYAQSLVRGLRESGRDVVKIGMVPTPVVYWAINRLKAAGGIQVTGSHNPADNNGFKMCIGNEPMPAATIQALRPLCDRALAGDLPQTQQPGSETSFDALTPYIEEIVDNVRPHLGQRKLKVVVDAGNGVAGILGVPVLKALGMDVVEIFCEPDGTFPNHHPDPTLPENVESLAGEIKKHGADFGIGWDGDGDRIVVLDENGRAFPGDFLLLALGRALLASKPGATIVADVKCSQVLFDDLAKRGARVVMCKSGHSSIKQKLKELKADIAGELSGHICYGDRFHGFDCAVYDTARFVEIMSNTTGPCSSLMNGIPELFSTKEDRFDCPDDRKFEVVARAVKRFSGHDCSLIDGIRVTMPDGWILLRASNTQPVLVSRVEANTPATLEQYKTMLSETLRAIDAEFAA